MGTSVKRTGNDSKDNVRQEAYSRRLALPAAERAQAAVAMMQNFLSWVPLPEKGAIVSGYMPFNAEIDARALMEHFIAKGHTCVIPHVTGDHAALEFHVWTPAAKMEKNIYGIAEVAQNKAHPLLPDFMIVPLVAFDAQGNRMGYGAGQFDRTFASLRKVKTFFTVGVAYDSQKCAHVPTDAYDYPLDMVVTDKTVYHCKENRK